MQHSILLGPECSCSRWGGGTAVGAGHSPQHRSPDAAAPGPELGDWPAAWGEGDKKDSGPAEKS